MNTKFFSFIGRSGAGKASFPSSAFIPPAAQWCCLSHQAVPAWAVVASHPYRPPDTPYSGPGAWDDTWPGGCQKQNNSSHNSFVSFIQCLCTPISLHFSASRCRQVLHLIAVWKKEKSCLLSWMSFGRSHWVFYTGFPWVMDILEHHGILKDLSQTLKSVKFYIFFWWNIRDFCGCLSK